MLLTFVESGEYRPVGGEKTKTAKVRIVGATNREKALRKDLRYRFFPFYVPALYERRDTILYYMYEKFPDVVTDLTRSQVLALLAYNWPGNVREIDRVARLIKRSKSEDERTKFESPSEKRRFESRYLHYLDPRYTSLRGELGDRILDDVSKLGKGDIKLLESLLGRFNVGLSSESTEPVLINAPKVYDFEKTVQWDEREKIREEFGVEMMPSIKPFEDAFQGYLAYCGLFMRHPMEEANSMEDLDKASLHFLSLDELHLTEEEKVKVEELVKSIMLSIRFVDIKGHVMPEDLFQYWDALGRLKEETEEREEELSWTEADREYLMDHLAAMTPDEARRLHLQSLLWKTGGVKRKAASLAGMAPSTFKDQVRKFRAGEKKD
jgi:DNA-binding NtrC family response regulator